MPDETSNQFSEGRTFTWLFAALSGAYFLPIVIAMGEHFLVGTERFAEFTNRLGLSPMLKTMYAPLRKLVSLFL